VTIAIDAAEAARPWIERAQPTHPSLIDGAHLFVDRYAIVNVPTVIWIDEGGRIVRPNDVAFTTERGGEYAGVSTAAQMAGLRAWVRGAVPPPDPAALRALQRLPSDADQQARAHVALGRWLFDQGRAQASARHFERGGELAPHDFVIRRGTMPLRGMDPFGEDFRTMAQAWRDAGHRYYEPLPVGDTVGGADPG